MYIYHYTHRRLDSVWVADALFVAMADRWLTHGSTRRGYGICAYWRFRDDLLVVNDSFKKTRRLCAHLRHRLAPIYKMEGISVSKRSAEMLALSLEVRGCRVHCFPKPRPFARPLGMDSAHPMAVHLGWPKAYLNTISQLSTCSKDAFACQQEFLRRLRYFHTPEPLVSSLESRNIPFKFR